MGNIQELYDTRVRPMAPPERLHLARLILDDLAPCENSVGTSGHGGHDDVSEGAAHVGSPRLARREQARDFAKQVVELASDARV